MPGTSGTGETTPNFGRVTVGAGTRGAGALVAGVAVVGVVATGKAAGRPGHAAADPGYRRGVGQARGDGGDADDNRQRCYTCADSVMKHVVWSFLVRPGERAYR